MNDVDRIPLTLHQVQRLVTAFYDLDDCKDLNDVANRVFVLSAQHEGCEECDRWTSVRSRYLPGTVAAESDVDK